MKIKQEKELGLLFFDEGLEKSLLQTHIADWEKRTGKSSDEWEEDFKTRISFAEAIFEPKGNKNLIVTQRAHDLIEGIHIEEDKFDLKIFSSVPQQKRTFLLGQNRFFRYSVVGDEIFCAIIKITGQDPFFGNVKIDYFMFPINTRKGYIDVASNFKKTTLT